MRMAHRHNPGAGHLAADAAKGIANYCTSGPEKANHQWIWELA